MFAVYDAVRVVAFKSRSARPNAPVVDERARGGALWSAKARLAASDQLHRLADALSPNRE
jgi:hypothetical protein